MNARGRGRGRKKAKYRNQITSSTLYLKGVEKELTVHPDLPPKPSKGVGQAHEHDVMHSKDQYQHQC